MNTQQYGKQLYKKCQQVQLKLYQQIEKLEHYMNLVKMAKPKGADILKTKMFKEKISTILYEMNNYKTKLQANAYFVDVKLSVIKKEMAKQNATKESLSKISEKLYSTKTIIKVPEKLKEQLKEFNIKFDNNNQIDLDTTITDKKEAELSI